MTVPCPPRAEASNILASEVIAVFRLSTLPGWVYIAMTGDEGEHLYNDVQALVAECGIVARDDTTISQWDDSGIVLSMGTGQPIFYRIVGQEFEQTLLALTHPPAFHNSSDSFSVGEWVCIACPGTYWGDVGLVWSMSDDEDTYCITVLLVPQITDEVDQATYSNTFVRPPLREELRPHTSDDPPLH
jgi:hypothetical protein